MDLIKLFLAVVAILTLVSLSASLSIVALLFPLLVPVAAGFLAVGLAPMEVLVKSRGRRR